MFAASLVFVFSSLASVVGALAGWFLHGRCITLTDPPAAPHPAPHAAPTGEGAPPAQAPAEQQNIAAEVFARLAELTDGVTDEVERHSGNIAAINAELASIQDGDSSAVVLAVRKILDANNQMQQKLEEAELRMQAQQLELQSQTEAARTDQLTKITNRRALDELLAKCVADFKRKGRPATIMMIDVDHFKKFNDTHGHQAGDEVLKHVARTLKSVAQETEVVARYGGEEFTVVFPGKTAAAVVRHADEIRAAIGQCPINFEGKELRVAASSGIAELAAGENEQGAIKRADDALYASKKAGRNCAHWNNGGENLLVNAELEVPEPKQPPQFAPLPAAASAASETPALKPLSSIEVTDVAFRENLDRRIAEMKRGGHVCSLVLLRIDGFGELIGKHGPVVGDSLLKVMIGYIRSNKRDQDQLARCGVDGFSLLLTMSGVEGALIVAERIRKAVEKYVFPDAAAGIRFTLCAGVAELDKQTDSQAMLERAERALEVARCRGPGQVEQYDPAVDEPVEDALATELVGA